MATIQTRQTEDGKPRYRVQIRLKGYPLQTATFDRKTDAREWAQTTEADIKAGRHFKTAEAKRHTFRDMVDRYLRDVMPHKNAQTQRAQIRQLAWWKEQLGERPLADISPALIAETRDRLAGTPTPSGKPRAPATVARYLAALSHCYSVAVKEWGWLDDTPMRKVAKPREPRGRVRFLSDDERGRLLRACESSTSAYLYPIVVLALSTGMRRGEIMNLTWDRVDIQRRLVILRADDTKTGEARAVPIVGLAHDILSQIAQERTGKDTLVFPAPPVSGQPERPLDIQSAWMRALRVAEIEDFRFHDLRHSAASYLAMNGASLAEIADVLGHKTVQMAKRYSHLTDAHTTGIVEKMNEAVFGD